VRWFRSDSPRLDRIEERLGAAFESIVLLGAEIWPDNAGIAREAEEARDRHRARVAAARQGFDYDAAVEKLRRLP
jgi:hypothetical protein